MLEKTFDLILGSASPRRKELMQHTYLPFRILSADLEEKSDHSAPIEMVQDLALQKAQYVFHAALSESSNPFVIGADTIVVTDGKILGKPANAQQAQAMLKSLSNKTHQVYTGVAFCWKNQLAALQMHKFYQCTDVTFGAISDDLMQYYLATNESLDKAGAYGIQGAALGFIEKINGSYSNVVGLPVDLVIVQLKNILDANDDSTGEWRRCFISNLPPS